MRSSVPGARRSPSLWPCVAAERADCRKSKNFWLPWGGRTEMTVQTKAPESQFAYVVLAARRARQLMAGAPPLLENPRTQKPTRIACEELEHNLLEYDVPEATSVDEDKDGKRKK